VLTTGRRLRRPHLDIFWAINETGEHPRLGLVVAKARESGVARNRLRRRLKELWRRELQQRLPPWDVVIRTRREAYLAPFAALRDDLVSWREAVAG
jgi:ribonuclease P protein component